jgi:hypothetical protein
LCGRLGEKLLEVFEKIGRRVEKAGDLRIDVLDRFLLALVCLENFEELLVDFGFILEAVLVCAQSAAMQR